MAEKEVRLFYFRYYLTLRLSERRLKLSVSPDPQLEKEWAAQQNEEAEVWCWDRPFPLWLAEKIWGESQPWLTEKAGFSLRRFGRMLRRICRRYAWPTDGDWVPVSERLPRPPMLNISNQVAAIVSRVLPGRELTPLELVRACARQGIEVSEEHLERILHRLLLAGAVERVAGIGLDRLGRFSCRRCGEGERIHRQTGLALSVSCRICPACCNLGTITDLVPLYRWSGEWPVAMPQPELKLLLPEFSPWQQQAAEEALRYWRDPKAHTLLIWAVCGAGKTEVVFPVLKEALTQGKRVLLTVPRREILRELAERLRRNFPGLDFTLMYGGEKEEVPESLLVVATTHQLLRFGPCFDLVILDEADAFPLYGNPMLNAALEKVLLPTGKKIYMTATPDASWRQRAKRGEIAVAKIPLRYHGHLLPVPTLVRCKLPSKHNWFLPPIVTDFIQSLSVRGRRGLIFLPTIDWAEEFGRRIKSHFSAAVARFAYVHAQDPERAAKIGQFSAGQITVLFTTTLLERGLNFKDLDVMILFADQRRIFSAETLIQIAGRVGRSADDPEGEVYFVAETISPEMKEAKEAICRMNKEAEQVGRVSRPGKME